MQLVPLWEALAGCPDSQSEPRADWKPHRRGNKLFWREVRILHAFCNGQQKLFSTHPASNTQLTNNSSILTDNTDYTIPKQVIGSSRKIIALTGNLSPTHTTGIFQGKFAFLCTHHSSSSSTDVHQPPQPGHGPQLPEDTAQHVQNVLSKTIFCSVYSGFKTFLIFSSCLALLEALPQKSVLHYWYHFTKLKSFLICQRRT